jgi:hypothetical protein
MNEDREDYDKLLDNYNNCTNKIKNNLPISQ